MTCREFEDLETSGDPLLVRLRDTFDALMTVERALLAYAAELEAMPGTSLIGPGAVAARIRAVLGDATATDKP